jgi:hypothetical protein
MPYFSNMLQKSQWHGPTGMNTPRPRSRPINADAFPNLDGSELPLSDDPYPLPPF